MPDKTTQSENSSKEILINQLRTRAETHRKYAWLYTGAMVGVILFAISLYFIFQQSKLNELQESNSNLNSSYIKTLENLKTYGAELKTEVSKTREVVKDFYDSLSTEQQQVSSLSIRITERIPKLLDEIDVGAIRISQESIDSLNSALLQQLSTVKTFVGYLHRFINQIRRTNAYNLHDGDFDYWDTRIADQYRQEVNNLIAQITAAKLTSPPGDTVLLNSSIRRLTALQSDVTRATHDIQAISDVYKNLGNLYINFDSSYDYHSSDFNQFVNGIRRVTPRVKDNSTQLNSLIQAFEHLQIKVSNQTDLGPAGTLKKLDKTLQEQQTKISGFQDQFDTLKEAVNLNEKNRRDVYGDLPAILARYGLIIFLIYVIQLMLSYAKYHYRLASFYDSKSDAIQLTVNIADITTMDLIKLLDASQVGFGRSEHIYQKLYESIRDFAKTR